MKSKLLLLSSALLMLCAQSIAQGTSLTFANSGLLAGDLIKTHTADTTGIVQGPSGANQTWNFAALVVNPTLNTQTCVAPSTTPYASSFPTATVAISNGSSNYEYYKINTGEYINLGMVVSANVIPFSDPQKIVSYPFSYSNTLSDNIAATFVLGINTIRKGTSTTTADAWGTLILPSGSYTNTLRIKIIQDYVDSNLYYKATTHQESYLWFDGTHKNPLLNITKSSVFNTMSSTTTKTKSILVSEISSNNSISQYDWSLASENIFPNPTSGKATISFDLKEKSNTEISVFDMQGREAIHNELGNLEAGTNQKEIDISDIPQGTYLIRISAGDGYSYKKIIKK